MYLAERVGGGLWGHMGNEDEGFEKRKEGRLSERRGGGRGLDYVARMKRVATMLW